METMRSPTGIALFMLLFAPLACSSGGDGGPGPGPGPSPQPLATLIGVEYAIPGVADEFAAIGLPAVKHFPDNVRWGQMQPVEGGPIDFAELDRFVEEYQAAGFRQLMIALRSNSPWGSKNELLNPTPKPEHLDAYAAWITAIIERYDADGTADMPGLRFAVKHVEIGTEFSTYEPGPVAEYLSTLARAYSAAHAANPQVIVMHAAFLTTTVFDDNPTSAQYGAAFAGTTNRILHHNLADMRAILDRPELFDWLNVHALGDPLEIEAIAQWLKFEMAERGYTKPIAISDTTPAPLIAWGAADDCSGTPAQMGLVIRPAVESERCKIAELFQALIANDPATLAWARGFIAADMVQKSVIATEQGYAWINTCFMEDLFFLQAQLLHAGAGLSAWAGMAETRVTGANFARSVVSERPSFHAMKQLMRHLEGVTTITRVSNPDPAVRLYELAHPNGRRYIAWRTPTDIAYSGDPVPSSDIAIAASAALTMEFLIQEEGRTTPRTELLSPDSGDVTVPLTAAPVFLRP